MKKIDTENRQRLLRLINRRNRRRIHQKRTRSDIMLERSPFDFENLDVPEIACLYADSSGFLRFINELQNIALIEKKRLKINFDNTLTMSDEAAIILAAEVERCRSLRFIGGRPTVSGKYPLSGEIRDLLTHLGFFNHLKLVAPKVNPLKSKKIIQIRSGIRVKAHLIEELYDLVFSQNVSLSRSIKSNLFRGLSEAMTNVAQHAYVNLPRVDQKLPFLGGRWWMSCYRDDASQTLGAYLYDQGVGIPATVPYRHAKPLQALALRLGLGNGDADMIKAAMELGRTATGEANRGKGMSDLRLLIDHTPGELRITSGRGRYVLVNDGSSLSEDIQSMKEGLRGTLVAWSFKQV